MNDGKPTREAQAQTLAEDAVNQAGISPVSQSPDLRRRRLIRGAVGIAPVVLTLRSGALTAASSLCAAAVDPASTELCVEVNVTETASCQAGRLRGTVQGTVVVNPSGGGLICVKNVNHTPINAPSNVVTLTNPGFISTGSVTSLMG